MAPNRRRAPISAAVTTLVFIATTGCHNTRIDTVEIWCEHMTGVDVAEKYAPFWVVFPSVSFDDDAVRQSYTHMLDSLSLTIVGGRAPRMAWQDGMTLNVNSISDLMDVSRDSVLHGWREGLARGLSGKTLDAADKCFFGAPTALFDTVKVHFHALSLGDPPDTVIAIPTGRRPYP